MFGISVNFSRQKSLYKFVLFKKFQSYKTLFKILKIFIRNFFFTQMIKLNNFYDMMLN